MVVLYIDMDYFFAACEEVRHPELKGKPLIVGTSDEKNKLKGVVQTCNYEARKYGIRSAMPTVKAFSLCKDLNYMPAEDAYYEESSQKIMQLIKGYGFVVEQDSIDEAAVDMKDLTYEKAAQIGTELKDRINKEFKLPCTIGISSGKYLAKMMCDASKPNGFGILYSTEVKKFLEDKSIDKLPGVGEKTEEKLKKIGIKTIDDLAKYEITKFIDKFGSSGIEMHRLANGIDDSKVVGSEEILSIGRESTLPEETIDTKAISRKIKALSNEVAKEAAKKGVWFKNVGLKVRYADFTQVTRSSNISHYSESSEEIHKIAMSLLKGLITEKKIRKVGVRVASFVESKKQKRLF